MKKPFAIAGVIVAIGLAVGVYQAKLGAQETAARIKTLKADIAREQTALQTDRAEVAYLSRAERIGPLAQEKLGLRPAKPEQFTAVEMMARRLGADGAPQPARPAAATTPPPARPAAKSPQSTGASPAEPQPAIAPIAPAPPAGDRP